MFYDGVGILLSNIDNGVAQREQNISNKVQFMFTVKLSVNITCKGFSDLSQ